jgi:hypothetical protein
MFTKIFNDMETADNIVCKAKFRLQKLFFNSLKQREEKLKTSIKMLIEAWVE